MRQRTFIWSVGTKPLMDPGWLPENAAPGWYPGAGFLSAHDVVEHLSNKGDWPHELRAAGVAAYAVAGVAQRNPRSIAEDIVSFAARDHLFEVPDAPPLGYKPLPAADETKVLALVSLIRQQADAGLKRALAARADVPVKAEKNEPSFADNAEPWIRLGYRAALRVYGKGEGRATGAMMDKLRDAINENHNNEPPLDGDKLTVRVDTKAKTFTLERTNVKELSKVDRARQSAVQEMQALLFGAFA